MAEIILALDMASGGEALGLLDRLPEARWVKVGSILFTSEGPPLVRELRRRGLEVFLDLKWHDIPNTVAGSVASARELGVAMATVHTLGGIPMMRAAQEAAGGAVALVGVTVLTSHDDASFGQVRAGWHGGVGRGTPPGGQRPGRRGWPASSAFPARRGGSGSAWQRAPGSSFRAFEPPMRHPTISGGPPRPRRRCGTVLPIWSWGGR